MKTVLLGFAIFSIISQIPCTDYVVKLGSNLRDKTWSFWFMKNIPSAKRIQAGVFSIIISNAIMFTVLLGMHWIALVWMIVEIAIACLYVHDSMIRRHSDRRRKRAEDEEEKDRINRNELIAGYSMAVLIPVCIYAFSFMYVKYEWIMEFFNG